MTTETIGFYSYAEINDGDSDQEHADRFSNIIAFKPVDPDWNGVGPNLMLPNAECGLTIEEIARKDVPEGSPFVILTYHDFPWTDDFIFDIRFIKAWAIDFTNPDGIGENQNG